MYKERRRLLSQNFFTNRSLVKYLLRRSSIGKNDTVVEIGAGKGIITKELTKICKSVIAVEIDPKSIERLHNTLGNSPNLEIHEGNFLEYTLPSYPYKVFSNIPFIISAQVIKKLTQSPNPPKDVYLVVQAELAKKYTGKPYSVKNSLIAILLNPFFQLSIIHNFKRSNFTPIPRVETVLLRIKKRKHPLINIDYKKQYEDFIAYSFTQTKPNIGEGLSKVISKQKMKMLSNNYGFSVKSKPSELNTIHWRELYKYFSNKVCSKNKEIVEGAYKNLQGQQKYLRKIHRTRVDKKWRSF